MQGKLIELMKDLTATSTGVLDYSDMCLKLGSGVINSMIKYNIICLRPTSRLANDVPNHANPIITAESPAAFIAMKKVLEKHWKHQFNKILSFICIVLMFLGWLAISFPVWLAIVKKVLKKH